VVLNVVWVTQLVRAWAPAASITVAMVLIPFSSLVMATSHWFTGNVMVFGAPVHTDHADDGDRDRDPGIRRVLPEPQVPRVRIEAGAGRPRGPVPGLCAHEHVLRLAVRIHLRRLPAEELLSRSRAALAELQAQHAAWLAGQAAMPSAYAHAHYLWYAFAGVGALSLVAMLVFTAVTRSIDARQAKAA
jgi:hypothetical protein